MLTLVEALLAWRYAVHDAMFHYWLHGAVGAALGFTLLAIVRYAEIDVRWGAGEVALADTSTRASPT